MDLSNPAFRIIRAHLAAGMNVDQILPANKAHLLYRKDYIVLKNRRSVIYHEWCSFCDTSLHKIVYLHQRKCQKLVSPENNRISKHKQQIVACFGETIPADHLYQKLVKNKAINYVCTLLEHETKHELRQIVYFYAMFSVRLATQ